MGINDRIVTDLKTGGDTRPLADNAQACVQPFRVAPVGNIIHAIANLRTFANPNLFVNNGVQSWH